MSADGSRVFVPETRQAVPPNIIPLNILPQKEKKQKEKKKSLFYAKENEARSRRRGGPKPRGDSKCKQQAKQRHQR